jgi:hypothetical protein
VETKTEPFQFASLQEGKLFSFLQCTILHLFIRKVTEVILDINKLGLHISMPPQPGLFYCLRSHLTCQMLKTGKK